jgi:plastocyanin
MKYAGASLAAVVALVAVANAAGAKEIVVKMGSDTGQLVFVPTKIDAAPGDTIKWTMNKAGPHNAVFDAAKSADGAVAGGLSQKKLLSKPGDSYVSTIPANAKKGTYDFNCVPHKSAGMKGTLTVK